VKVLGISPLDKDATASFVEDGRVLYAAGEERFSRVKQHAGFPAESARTGFSVSGWKPEDVDVVAYPFLDWEQETRLIRQSLEAEGERLRSFTPRDFGRLIREAAGRIPERNGAIHGLAHANERMAKSLAHRLLYLFAGGTPWISKQVCARESEAWARQASTDHRRFQGELERGIGDLGLLPKLQRFEHHLSHSANAYYASGFDRALIVTLDGYGTGLAGSVGLGEGGKISRLKAFRFPHSLGTFYEMVTSSLGFNPDRHAGKVVGLAAYGDPEVLTDVLMAFVERPPGEYRIRENLNVYISRYLSTKFPKVDLAAAYQHVLEIVASDVVAHWVRETGCPDVVLSGGVTANVKMNQRIHDLDGVRSTFVYPNMGDGGCGTGLGFHLSRNGRPGEAIRDVYLGPDYSDGEIRQTLEVFGLPFTEPADLAGEIARRIHSGQVVARFRGRMEYGPRALGNRSILYHAREPEVNHWLNKRLGRTEFMPFAPVTLWEARDRCYKRLEGAEHAAEFMTITFDCTDWMKKSCPAAVHVDGTARPQLIRRETNPEYYRIVEEYEKLSGIPSLINTSFNMHEEPIVCSPRDAIRAFLQGHLDAMAIGPFLTQAPSREASP
jgi:carbamoyltransferase